jgi:ribosomal protein S18 acetylase RimI-like enzyme
MKNFPLSQNQRRIPIQLVTFDHLPGERPPEILIELIKSTRPKSWMRDYPGIIDLHELLALNEVRKNCFVWLNQSDKAIAFTILDPYDNFVFECFPDMEYAGIFSEALIFCQEAMREKYKNESEIPTLDASCRADDYQRLEQLDAHGFIKQPQESISFVSNLDDRILKPSLPEGFTIRPLNGFDELDAYISLHQAAFNSSQMTHEFRKAIMENPDFDPELDLVVAAPDGRLVGFCVCQIFQQENLLSDDRVGWTDPIGVHPEFRRLGLAKELISAGLHLLKEKGMRQARLDTSSDNHAMIALAIASGFEVSAHRMWFSKK